MIPGKISEGRKAGIFRKVALDVFQRDKFVENLKNQNFDEHMVLLFHCPTTS
ncbi:MAG: hypothetical protein LBV12_02715 [Puniceicoccales bacterium]|jgi:hypothetical protein|nr:hypothetical protein [Puniceicoccales bacterium]